MNTMHFWRYLAMFLASLFSHGLLAQTTFNATVTTGSPTFVVTGAQNGPNNHYLGGDATCRIELGTHYYATQTFTAASSGSHTVNTTALTGFINNFNGQGRSDNFIALYAGVFNPQTPESNLVGCNDDLNVVTLWARFTSNLSAGQTYTVVFTSYLETNDGPASTTGSGSFQIDRTVNLDYTVGGAVSGLANGKSVTLLNNGVDARGVSANGSFVFGGKLSNESPYSVTVGTHPDGQTCSVSRGTGYINNANVTDMAVSCTTEESPGVCGSANGIPVVSAPSANTLCYSGTASTVSSSETFYTWSCSTASCSAKRHYVVNTSTDGNGSISPNAAQNVAYNTMLSFAVSPNAGYEIQSVTGCSGSLSGNTYTTGPISAACTVSARFKSTVVAVDGFCGTSHGQSLSNPPGNLCTKGTPSSVTSGNTSYAWNCSGSDGGSMASCSATRLYTVSTTGANGNITPPTQYVAYNATPSFTVTPNTDYVIQTVTGCSGTRNGNSYVTGPITASCSVSASFVAAPKDGACGSAISRTLSSPPLAANDSAALCKNGADTKTGPQTWTCSGSNGGATTSCSSAVPLDGGLVGHWSFDAANSIIDGQVSGGVSFQDGKIGKSAVFGGVDNPGQIKIANSPSLQFGSGATFSVWVRFDGMKGMDDSGKIVLGTGFSEAMLAKSAVFPIGTNTKNSGIFSDGPYDMWFSLNSSEAWATPGTALWQPMLEIGEWAHVVYALSATEGVRQYVNGRLYRASALPVSFSSMNTEDLYLGQTKDARLPLLGALDELRIYNRALTEAEIGQLTSAETGVEVVEFYHSSLDHYFITADANEAKAIDSGTAGAEWKRSGYQFKSAGSAAVCRFYGSISPGPNSHFYTADANECASLKQLQASTPAGEKRWNYESIAFEATLPVAPGVCPTGMVPIYRAYNNGSARAVDSNHRIGSQAAMQEAVGRGWINEGVVMCALP